MKKLMWTFTFLASIVSTVFSPSCYADGHFELVAQLTGDLPGDATTGDNFGVTLTISNGTLVVGAPGSSPQNQDSAGAAYFFQQNENGNWVQSQKTFTIPVAGNLVSDLVVAARKNWLFVPVIGTPLNQSDPTQKDYSGAVLVFKRNKHSNQWELKQTIFNPEGTEAGKFSFFGFNLDYDGGDYAVIGGSNVSTTYFYKINLDTQQWELAQTVTLPDNGLSGYILPSISGTHVLLTQPVPVAPAPINGVVYAYELVNGVWTYLQTLTGQSPISQTFGNGDFFGEYIDIDSDWALISAPLDNSVQDCAGAAYFFHFEKGQWVQKQKVYSDRPSALFGFGLALQNDIAVIGDSGRTVNGNIFQGAGFVLRKFGDQWFHTNTLFDPNGRAYDFFGGAVEVNQGLVAIGDDTFSDQYIPPTFPGVRQFPYNPPANNGRVLLYSYDQ